jgi:phosphatidylglycerol---prolipoprotein diacylglyceryl transferase
MVHDKAFYFKFKSFGLISYGFFTSAAFCVGIALSFSYLIQLRVYTTTLGFFVIFIMIPFVVLGARIFSMLESWSMGNKIYLKNFFQHGYAIQGGAIATIISILIATLFFKINLLSLLDAASLALLMGESVGRLGCSAYGCCWGKPSNSHFVVRYYDMETKVLRLNSELKGVGLIPIQIITSIYCLAILVVSLFLIPKIHYAGYLMGMVVFFHGLGRFVIDYFRGDDLGTVLKRFSLSSFIAFFESLFAIGVMILAAYQARIISINNHHLFQNFIAIPHLFSMLTFVGVFTLIVFSLKTSGCDEV